MTSFADALVELVEASRALVAAFDRELAAEDDSPDVDVTDSVTAAARVYVAAVALGRVTRDGFLEGLL